MAFRLEHILKCANYLDWHRMNGSTNSFSDLRRAVMPQITNC